MGIKLLEELDDRKRAILGCILQFQINDEKGINYGILRDLKPVKKRMSPQTFSHRLKELVQDGLVIPEVMENRRGKPTLYRLESQLFEELKEIRKFLSLKLEEEIENYDKQIKSFPTPQYVEAMMELANCLLDSLIIISLTFKTEGAKAMLYDSTYTNIQMLYRNILERASKSPEDRKQTLTKLFEILKPLSKRPIGKHFGFDVIYDNKEKLLKKST